MSQWRQLPQLLSRGERRLLLVCVIFFGVSVAAVVLGGGNDAFSIQPRSGGSWVEGVVGAPKVTNPLLALRDTDRDIGSLVYSGLMRENTDGTLVPDLAEKLVVSPEGTRYTLTLRKNVLFHDGEPFGADDVLFTYQSIKDSSWRSPYRKSLADVTVSAPDADTIVFAMGKPFSVFPRLLTIGIVPQHIWKDVGADGAPYAIWNVKPVGTGPFQFSSLTRDRTGAIQELTFSRNEQFYERSPYLAQITFRIFHDLPSALVALQDGRADGVFANSRHATISAPEKRFRTMLFDTPQVVGLYFNPKKTALTKEVRVALTAAIDREGILARMEDDAREARSPVPPGALATEKLGAYAHDVSLLMGLRALKTPQPGAFTMTAPADPFYHEIATAIVDAWKAAGADVTLVELPSRDFLAAVHDRNYDALLWSNLMPYGVDLYPYWHSSQIDDPGFNFAGYRNRRADTLLESLRTVTDVMVRQDAYLQLTSMIRDDIAAVFLLSPRPSYIVARRLHGEMPAILDFSARRFSSVRDWYVRRG